MSKLTSQTTYGAMRLKNPPLTVTGSFVVVRIFRFGESLVAYYDPANGHVYPWNEVLWATATA